MKINEYQEKAHSTAMYLESAKKLFGEMNPKQEKLLSLMYAGMGLGEVGEVQNHLKKILRDSAGEISEDVKKEIVKELGDITWYIAELCTIIEVDLEDVLKIIIPFLGVKCRCPFIYYSITSRNKGHVLS